MTSGEFPRLPLNQPLGLCNIIDMAFRIWRQQLPLIFRVLLLPTIVYFASATALQWCFTWGIAGSGNELPKMIGTFGLGIIALLFFLASMAILAEKQLSLLRLFLGFSPNWQSAEEFGRKKFWWLVGLYTVLGLLGLVLGGIDGCVIGLSAVIIKMNPLAAILGAGGILFGIVALVLLISALILLGFMLLPVLACEELSFFSVLGRTFHWTFKPLGRVLCFCFLYYVIFWAVSVPVSLPVVAVSIADVSWTQIQTGAAPSSDRLSLGVMIFAQFWDALCSLLLRPVSMLAFGVLYLDLRQRIEGMDIFIKLRANKAKLAD